MADLFAGTGNLGLEALSRGARSAIFVDNSIASMKLIKENTLRASLADKSEFYQGDVLAAIEHFRLLQRRFHILFCDPPYNRGFIATVLPKIDASAIMLTEGVVIVEHSKHEALPEHLLHLQCKRTERYGETLVSFLVHKKN